MTRKIIALVLAMVMCLGFAGCGKTEENENVLRVAMECAYAPYNWTQNDDSNGAVPISGTNDYAYGYDVMMAKLIAESMGKELEIVKLDWDALVPAVMSGDVDLVIAGQSITAAWKEAEDKTPLEAAVDAAGKSMKRVWTVVYLPCPYTFYERVKLEVAAWGGIIRDTQFGAEVELEILVPEASAEPFLAKLIDMSAGTLEGMETGKEYRAFPVE